MVLKMMVNYYGSLPMDRDHYGCRMVRVPNILPKVIKLSKKRGKGGEI